MVTAFTWALSPKCIFTPKENRKLNPRQVQCAMAGMTWREGAFSVIQGSRDPQSAPCHHSSMCCVPAAYLALDFD